MAKLKENSRKVFDWVKAHDGEQHIAKDIAEALDLDIRQVNGIITAAFQRKGLMERVPATAEINGEKTDVKLIQLTDAGREFDPDAPDEAVE